MKPISTALAAMLTATAASVAPAAEKPNVTIPLPVESDSFNAQPEAPACSGVATKKAGASGWALNAIPFN